jgi:hypothetical protein
MRCVLAGGNDSSADSLQGMLWTPPSSSSSSNMGYGASKESNAAADPKKALLGMCLINLSQVSNDTLLSLQGRALQYGSLGF